MPSHFGWIDFAEEDRQQMLNVVHLFREQDTRDELGIGTIRDAFADYFFPGTSTIQTRARYMLFVPWIYQDLERKKVPSSKIAKRARQAEIRLIYALLESEDHNGVIGIDAKEKLQRLPSNIYWSGLGSWGIRPYPGSQEQYHRFLDTFYGLRNTMIVSDDKEEVIGSINFNWDPDLPEQPENLFDYSELSLEREEAIYLRDRINIKHPDSFLSVLANEDILCDADFLWNIPCNSIIAGTLQGNIRHARNFSELIYGAALLYNLMLARESGNEQWIGDYEERIIEWKDIISARWDELTSWYSNLALFWDSSPLKAAQVPRLSRSFVDQWLELIFSKGLIAKLEDNNSAHILIRDREIKLKKNRARLDNQRALETWSGTSASNQLDFRWAKAKVLIRDIFEGLRNGVKNA